MEEEVVGKIYDRKLTGRLLRYLLPYKGYVAIALVFLGFNSVLQIAGPLLMKLAVDRYLAPTNAQPMWTPFDGWLASDPWTGLAQISLLYFLAVIGALVLDFGQTILMQQTGQNAMFDLRRQLMGHLQRLDVQYFDRNPVGRLVTRVTTDVDVLNELFSTGIVTMLGDLLVISFVVLAMFQLSPGLTLILLGVMPFVILVTVLFRRAVSQSYRRIRVAIAKINSHLQEHVNGIAVLQLFNREKKSGQEFERVNREHMVAFKDSISAYGWFYPIVEWLSMLALAAMLAWGGWKITSGALTLGILVAFFQYGMRFFRPIQDLSEKYNILQSAMSAAERIFKLMDTEPEIVSPAAPVVPVGSRIEFDHVWFAYKGEDWVLQDVSFTIEEGETIAVVGHTGAGKTTLANLLLRFYDVQKGTILVGGVDVKDCDVGLLRRQFGIVLQDPYLFSGTIADNIRLGTEGISDEAIAKAAAEVNLRDYIERLPEHFE
ncbi:MAG TPA: ABC transporter ATP-binding protein, partial [Bryobacteraceae bacterium]|nr:ABC transporter ATP-binding protein [Bryobacteraceae bacterium]